MFSQLLNPHAHAATLRVTRLQFNESHSMIRVSGLNDVRILFKIMINVVQHTTVMLHQHDTQPRCIMLDDVSIVKIKELAVNSATFHLWDFQNVHRTGRDV
jgi:hypothetical protein